MVPKSMQGPDLLNKQSAWNQMADFSSSGNINKSLLHRKISTHLDSEKKKKKKRPRDHATHLARGDRRTCQVELLRGAAERSGIPVPLVARAAAGLRDPGEVDLRQGQPTSELRAPAAGPHLVDRRRGLPAPVLRAVALEDDADVDARKGQREEAEQGEDSLLAAAERTHILQQVIEGGHGATAGFQIASKKLGTDSACVKSCSSDFSQSPPTPPVSSP